MAKKSEKPTVFNPALFGRTIVLAAQQNKNPTGMCAQYVSNAIVAAGGPNCHGNNGFHVEHCLKDAGWSFIASGTCQRITDAPANPYEPQEGDVALFYPVATPLSPKKTAFSSQFASAFQSARPNKLDLSRITPSYVHLWGHVQGYVGQGVHRGVHNWYSDWPQGLFYPFAHEAVGPCYYRIYRAPPLDSDEERKFYATHDYSPRIGPIGHRY